MKNRTKNGIENKCRCCRHRCVVFMLKVTATKCNALILNTYWIELNCSFIRLHFDWFFVVAAAKYSIWNNRSSSIFTVSMCVHTRMETASDRETEKSKKRFVAPYNMGGDTRVKWKSGVKENPKPQKEKTKLKTKRIAKKQQQQQWWHR